MLLALELPSARMLLSSRPEAVCGWMVQRAVCAGGDPWMADWCIERLPAGDGGGHDSWGSPPAFVLEGGPNPGNHGRPAVPHGLPSPCRVSNPIPS